jgi:hypothetical protein
MRAGPNATVHITEGASKSAPLSAAGLLATAVPYHKWEPECVSALAGRHLIYHEDHDDNGRKFSAGARKHLAPVAASFRVVPAAHLFKHLGKEPQPHADVKDWLEAGGDVTMLEKICRELPAATTLQSIRASEVTMTAVEWLWPNRFALGKLGLIVGLPEEGKGQVLCYMAAQVTKAGPGAWPCGEGYGPKGNVILLTAEDAIDDTVAPRSEAAGADRRRIEIVKMVREQGGERMFSLHTDLAMLREKIMEVGDVVLVLVDPISAYLGVGKVDSYRTTDVRAVLGPLVSLAAELKIAIIGIMYFNKELDVTNVLLRISDSLAYGATARHVYGVVNDPDNHRKLMVRAKNNLAAGGADQTLAFCFASREVGIDLNNDKPIVAPYVVWEAAHVDVSAVEAMQAANEFKSPTARDSAKQFLHDLLAAGPVASNEVDEAAKANGVSKRTLYRAKADLNIIAKKDNSTPDGVWTWRLPDGDGIARASGV